VFPLFRDPRDERCLALDGYGLSIRVDRGHLVLHDGLGRQRRERRLPRAQRTVRRILVRGHTGHITLDAIRWCHDTGITLTTIDADGRVLLTAGAAGRDDPRIRRAQAAAANSPVGLDIAKALMTAKIDGQAAVTDRMLGAPEVADTLRQYAADLQVAPGLFEARAIEATASNAYFGAWPGTVQARFATKDAAQVPQHWAYYAVRRSPIAGASPRAAIDPINAMLNYSYALAEAETRLALLALGLDPGLGIVHTDKRNRDSLALDLLEPLRPLAEQHVLTIAERRHLTRDDVHETRTGACRLLPPLTHDLADAIPDYATAAARLGEQLAHALARTVPGEITLTTPLSRANTAHTQIRGTRAARRAAAQAHRGISDATKVHRTCQQCGAELYGSARKLCPTCWPVTRNAHMRQLGLARAKPKPATPTTEQHSGGITLQQYQAQVLPRLAGIPLPELERATGLSNASCSRLARGLQIPHPRHWAALAALAEAKP
jgi:CRISPR-associated endonuclease Cas1